MSKRNLVIVSALFLASCGSSPNEELLEKLTMERDLLAAEVSFCDQKKLTLSKAEGEIALADWDKINADNIEHVSPEEADRKRIAIGKQLGIPADQVDWESVYKARGENAERSKSYNQQNADMHRNFAPNITKIGAKC
jgi:hypothetical protein